MAVSYADRQALAVLAPTVTHDLHISDAAYGWLLSAFSLAYLVSAPLAGRWIDRAGARRSLPVAVLVWSLVASAHALLPGPGAGLWVLTGLRVLLGVAESPSFPGATQTIHRALPAADRPRGFGVLYVGSSLGAMVVPPLASWLATRYGFRHAFLGVAVLGLAWLPPWLWLTRRPQVRRVLDRPAPAATPPHPSATPLPLLRQPAVWRGIAATLAAAPLMSYALNWGAKYLVATFHMTQADIGRVLWVPPVLYDLGSVGFGQWAARVMARDRVPVGPMGCAVGLAVIVVAVPLAHGPWQAILGVGLATAGAGGMFALFTSDTLARVPPQAVSSTAGILASAQSIAYIVAGPLIGWGVGSVGHPNVLWALAIWLLPGAAIWAWCRPRTRAG